VISNFQLPLAQKKKLKQQNPQTMLHTSPNYGKKKLKFTNQSGGKKN
jgi:hypothetical protein